MLRVTIFDMGGSVALDLENRISKIAISKNIFIGISHTENIDHFFIYGVEQIPSFMINEGKVYDANMLSIMDIESILVNAQEQMYATVLSEKE